MSDMENLKKGRNIEKVIIDAIKEEHSFFIWKSIAGNVEKCETKIKAFRKDYAEIELEVVKGQEKQIGLVVGGDKLINVYVPESSISFQTNIKKVFEENKIKLSIPHEYSFYERRKHERIIPRKTCYLSFENNKVLIKKSVFDISMGGLAIVLPKSDRVSILKGRLFSNMILEINGRKIKVNAECTNSFTVDRYKIENLPYGGFKVAFRFTEISLEDKSFLAEFITTELLLKKVPA